MSSFQSLPCSSSSNSTLNMNRATTLLSQVKCPTTFIIQPPSSSLLKPTTLLTKRCLPSDFEDILVKKVKTESTNLSESHSNQSPLIKENSEDGLYESSEGLECRSAIDDPKSPSSKSNIDESEKCTQMRILEDILIPQRSMSTPSSAFMLHKTQDPQRQIQNALEVLQKKILLEQQAAIIKNMIQRAQLTQEPLMIPPLQSALKSNLNPFENYGGQPKPVFKAREGEPEIIVGEVEYPLLSMASTLQKTLDLQNRVEEVSSKKGKRGAKKIVSQSSLSNSESDESEDEKETRKKRKTSTKKTSAPKAKKNQKRKEL